MRYDFAPMEGITGFLFRQLHHQYFPGVDRYYIPFLSPTQDHTFTPRELREVLPENNQGLEVVPQLLTKSPEDFLWAAGELSAMGYQTVNLNLGCPSGTVVAKGKGAGMLRCPEDLDRFLDTTVKFRLVSFLREKILERQWFSSASCTHAGFVPCRIPGGSASFAICKKLQC